MGTPQVDRRFFLARVGVLGALATAGTAIPGIAQASGPAPSQARLIDPLKKLLQELARDTINGLCVFAVPGPDAYSRRQGTLRKEPGALEARAPDFLMDSLDNYVPFPDQLAGPIGKGLATGLGDVPIALPGILGDLSGQLLGTLDDALKELLRNDETLPLSVVFALLLNTQAVRVDPTSVAGPFLSPFSRLTYANKAKVFELIEKADPELVSLVDDQLPEPVKGSVSGLLQFVGGAMLEFATFGAYCEWSTFDPQKLNVTSKPVGWTNSGYDAGSREGWNELKGYYQGRQKVSAD